MSQHTTLSNPTCTHVANDLIEAVAFGFATDEERRIVQDHVASCEICTEALHEARFAAGVLPLAAPDAGIDHHEAIWQGIEANLADASDPIEQQTISSPASQTPASPSPFRVHWAVAAVLALLTLAGGLLLGQMFFQDDAEPQQRVAQVEVTDPEISASGTVHYDADQGVLVLHMEDMPAAPEGFVYQVWVIEGETPVPVGVIDPQSSDFATASDPTRFQTLAVTLEEGPLGNALPTTDPIVVADLTQLGED